eukprot:354711-Chlamydomonas_euryale.AAC.3
MATGSLKLLAVGNRDLWGCNNRPGCQSLASGVKRVTAATRICPRPPHAPPPPPPPATVLISCSCSSSSSSWQRTTPRQRQARRPRVLMCRRRPLGSRRRRRRRSPRPRPLRPPLRRRPRDRRSRRRRTLRARAALRSCRRLACQTRTRASLLGRPQSRGCAAPRAPRRRHRSPGAMTSRRCVPAAAVGRQSAGDTAGVDQLSAWQYVAARMHLQGLGSG